MGKGSQKLIDRFNKRFPVGAPFRWRPVSLADFPYKTLTVRFPAYDSNGQAVVFANERNGYISIDPKFVDYSHESRLSAAE